MKIIGKGGGRAKKEEKVEAERTRLKMLIFSPTLPERATLQCLEMLKNAEHFPARLIKGQGKC